MAQIKPFRSIRPKAEFADRIAALPYDVYNRQEAKQEIAREPMSFLRIDRAETQFPDDVDTYDKKVYQKAHEILTQMIERGEFIKEESECYYIYELTMDGRPQTGIVACASIDDYLNQVIKKHENTRADKEIDRINHVDICNAQTGPIFLAYRARKEINETVNRVKMEMPIYDFISPDNIRHAVWCISKEADVKAIKEAFAKTEQIYIADGHHRCASAVKVGLKRRKEHPNDTGQEEFNYFLSVLFPDEQLMIMDYNRVVKDLNGHTEESFLQALDKIFVISEEKKEAYKPKRKGEMGMFLGGKWYCLTIRAEYTSDDPVEGLDVSILQNEILAPILDIQDPKTDKRIDFVGGIRGLGELERRVCEDCVVAFAMYPTSIHELFDVADAGLLMPPKSTWFEPKLRSGLFIHGLN